MASLLSVNGNLRSLYKQSEIEEESKLIPPTYVAAGDLYEGGKVEIRDSVVTRTDFGGKSTNGINIEGSIVRRSSIGEDDATEETTRLQCSNCGGELQEGWKACPSCGERVIMKCNHCGKEIEEGWKVCPYCGGKA